MEAEVLHQNYIKVLEKKNSLCYAISSMYLKYDKLLLVHISLEQANVKKATSLVKKKN